MNGGEPSGGFSFKESAGGQAHHKENHVIEHADQEGVQRVIQRPKVQNLSIQNRELTEVSVAHAVKRTQATMPRSAPRALARWSAPPARTILTFRRWRWKTTARQFHRSADADPKLRKNDRQHAQQRYRDAAQPSRLMIRLTPGAAARKNRPQ